MNNQNGATKPPTQAEQQVAQELGKQMDEFLSSKWSELEYEGKPMADLPEWFKEDFKKVILNTPPATNEILSHQLYAIGQAETKDLAVGQVGLMFSVFNFALPSSFETDYDSYVEKRKALDKIMLSFNYLHKSKEHELRESSKFMLSLYENGNKSKFHN